MGSDITNKGLGQFITMELVITLIVAGIAWGALSTKVTALSTEVTATEIRSATRAKADDARLAEFSKEQREIERSLAKANRKLDVLENNQDHFKRRFEQVEKNNAKILDILQRQYPNGNGVHPTD